MEEQEVIREFEVYWLGRVDYGEALKLQRERATARIRGEVEDCLLLVEHPSVITLGRGAKREHLLSDEQILKARGVEVWEIERGAMLPSTVQGSWSDTLLSTSPVMEKTSTSLCAIWKKC